MALLVALIVGGLLAIKGFTHGWGVAIAVGLGAGVAVGVRVVNGSWPKWSATGSVAWLFWIAPFVGVVIGLISLPKLPRTMYAVLVFIIGFFSAYCLLKFRFRPGGWDDRTGLLWLIGIAHVIVVWQWMLSRIAERRGPVAMHVTTLAVGLCAAILLTITDSLARGRFAGAVVGCAAAGVVVSLIFRRRPLAPGFPTAFSVFTVLLVGLSVAGAYMSPLSATLLLSSPVLAALCDVGGLGRITGWKHLLLRLTVTLVPPGLAIAMALPAFLKSI